jgi:vacuolar-type H+-ATPase subunit E/Vma4
MRHIHTYKGFIKESIKAIDKQTLIIEKQLYNHFSSNFWRLCNNSIVFTLEEKELINNHFIQERIDLLKEEWKFLDKAVDYFQDKSKEIKDKFTTKLKQIKDSIGSYVTSVKEFAKKIFFALIDGVRSKANEVIKQHKSKFEDKVKALDKLKLNEEKKQLIETFSWWGYVSKGIDDLLKVKPIENAPWSKSISSKIDSTQSNVESEAQKNISDAQKEMEEGKNESFENILNSTNDDVLLSFYLIKEQEETKEGCITWLLKFLEVEKLDPEVKTGKKLLWWGKLFLKILQACLNPIIILVEKVIVKNALTATSWITNQLGGPGPYNFVLLGGVAAGLFGVVSDFGLIFPIDNPFIQSLGFVKSWLAHALEYAGGIFPAYDTIKTFLKLFCLAMAMFHLSHAIHEYEESKEEIK